MSTKQPPPPDHQEDVDMPPAPPLLPAAPEQYQPPPPQSDPAPTSSDPIPSDQNPPEQPPEPVVTPGPRAQRLGQLFQQTTSHTLDKLSPANFRECFPTIAKKAPRTLDNVHQQMIKQLSTLWNREFERILESRQVIQKLNELEGLIQEAQQQRKRQQQRINGGGVPIPPHTLDADVVLQAHLRGYLKEQQGVLGERLGEVQEGNKKLFEEVVAQRREVEGLIVGVEKIVGDVRGASEVLGGVVGELEGETRQVDRELGKV
ncbi:Nnf1-domain-containing protein [Triangularia setosa]|uniref:Nnf1-domain-containing protein n=1 Tax=Triangularia setosa TaxID=2587417 RepID=A0AAN6W8I9_9PEZI|nr:Nnf1-domain-containing protein [Podospora setosa]